MTSIPRRRPATSIVVRMLSLLCLISACASARIPQTGFYRRGDLDPKVRAAIDEFRASVPAAMKKGKIPGYALALVDEQGIIYTEGFGYANRKKKIRATPDTPFLITGASKLVTATAAMLAVQDGLLDLDEPITTYLPDLDFNSRYEEHPEKKITLRHLLNMTAGLPGEAPLGNYFEPAAMIPFKDHVESLYGSWLVSPVGTHFRYSTSHIDLAAYAIQVASDKPFEQYMAERVFTPLGMPNTTVDRQQILRTNDRAVGSMMAIAEMAPFYPGLGTGGVCSTARDLAHFVQLHLNKGTLNGKRILQEDLIDIIHTPKGIVHNDPNYCVFYGMGMHVDWRYPERTELIYWQDGWGFGFSSFIIWYPEYRIGMVSLTNRLPILVGDVLALSLTDRLVKGKIVEKRSPRTHPKLSDDCLGQWLAWPDHKPTPYRPEHKKYCGTYNMRFDSYKLEWWAHVLVLILGRDEYTPRLKVHEKDGFLCVSESSFWSQVGISPHADEKLQELKPGVFCAASGVTLDFTRDVPTWRNYRIKVR